MSLVRFSAQNHPQQVGRHGAKSTVDDRETDPAVFAALNERFGFTLDAAASSHNAKCERYFTEQDDGLVEWWGGERVWCNPPYSNIWPWVRKAWLDQNDCPLIVMLLPANRTEQRWWQESVEPIRDRPGSPLKVEFLPGRMRFLINGADRVLPNQRPPFGCCLLIWEGPTDVDLIDGLPIRGRS